MEINDLSKQFSQSHDNAVALLQAMDIIQKEYLLKDNADEINYDVVSEALSKLSGVNNLDFPVPRSPMDFGPQTFVDADLFLYKSSLALADEFGGLKPLCVTKRTKSLMADTRFVLSYMSVPQGRYIEDVLEGHKAAFAASILPDMAQANGLRLKAS